MKIPSRALRSACAAMALAVAASAQAAPPIKTGLWEETTTVKRDPAPPRTETMQKCLIEQDLERVDRVTEQIRNNKHCKVENLRQSAHGTSSDWSCSAEGGYSSHGHGEVVYDDATHYHLSSENHSVMAGRNVDTSLSSQSRWLSADCGGVKPLSEYRSKLR